MEIRQLQSAPSSPHPSTPHSPTYRQGCSAGDTQSPELSHSQIRATVSQKAQTANTGARKCRKTASSHNAELAGWRPDGGDVTLRWPSSGPEPEHNSAFCWDQFRELWPGSGGGPRPAQTRRVVSRSQPPHGSGSAVGPCKGTTINYVSTDLEWGQKYVYIILK